MSRGCVTAISATHHILVFGYRLARVYEPRMQWQLSTRCGGQCSGLSRVKLLPAQRAAAWHRGTWRSVAAPLEEAVGRGDLAAVEVTAISATHHILVFGYRLARVYEPRMQWQLSTRCGGQCSGLSRVKLLPAQRAAAWHRWTWRSVAAPLEEAVGRGDLAAVEVTAISATHHILVFGYRLARVYEPRMQWQLSTRCGGQCSGLSRVKLLPAQRAAAWHRWTWRS